MLMMKLANAIEYEHVLLLVFEVLLLLLLESSLWCAR